jgi:hypothetical protein
MTFDPFEVNAAITGDISKAIYILFSIEPHLHDNGLDGLFDSIPADRCDHLGAPLRLVFDDTIGRSFVIQ